MRVLIVYAGRTGTTRKAAEWLAELVPGAVLRDLSESDPNPERYDAVAVGCGIYRGLIPVCVRKWLIRNEEALLGIPTGLFICNAFLDEAPAIFARNFPQALLDSCVVIDSFGGEFHPELLGAIDRRYLQSKMRKHNKMTGHAETPPALSLENIIVFAKKLTGS